MAIHTKAAQGAASSLRPAEHSRFLSERIEMLRIALIVGIMVVHIPYDLEHDPYGHARAGFDWFILFLREGLFRVGVPCLSVISGWLLAQQAARGYSVIVGKKFRTLMIPYFFFNLGAFALVLAMQSVGAGTYWPSIGEADATGLLNMLFGLSAPPINIPLYFLRDMMACILLWPILIWGARNAPAAVLIPILIFAVMGPQALMPAGIQDHFLFIIRPDILLFLYVGLVIGVRGLDTTAFDRYLGLALAVTLVGGAATMALTELDMAAPLRRGLLIGIKAAISLSIWILSARVVRSGFGQWMVRNGHLAFWLFCTHVPFMTLLFMVWGRTELPYELFYLFSVPVSVALLFLTHRVTRELAPQFLATVLGSRLKRERKLTPAAVTPE